MDKSTKSMDKRDLGGVNDFPCKVNEYRGRLSWNRLSLLTERIVSLFFPRIAMLIIIDFNHYIMKKILLTGAVALTLLGSCSKNDYGGPDIAGVKITVSASIDGLTTTRATDTEWAVDDNIGVTDNSDHTNVLFTATSTTGEFSSSTGIYILGGNPVSFTAYYPYSADVTESSRTLSFSIVDGSGNYVGSSAIDYMFADSVSATRDNPQVNFTFKHMMSKLTLNIADSSTTRSETTVSYTLKGVTLDGTFNTEDGTVTSGSTKGNVVMTSTLGTASSLILPAIAAGQEASAIEIIIIIGDKAYSGTITPGLSSSQEYLYNIDLSQTTEGSVLQIDSPTISDWTSNSGGNIPVAEQTNYNTNGLDIGDFYCSDGTLVDKDYDMASVDAATKAKIVGVIFYLGNPQPSELYGYSSSLDVLKTDYPTCTTGLVYAIKRADTALGYFGTLRPTTGTGESDWYTSYESSFITTTGNTDRILGYNYTALYKKFAEDDATTGAGATSVMRATLENFSATYPLTGTTTGWYLPSMGELNLMKEIETTLNASFAKLDDGEELWLGTDVSNSNGYWSSSLRRRDAVLSYLNGADDPDATVGYFNSASNYYRFAFAFSN